MGAQKANLFDHIEKLTEQLAKSWDTIAAILSGRIRMYNITIQPGDLLVIEDPHHSPDGTSVISMAGKRLHQVLHASGKPCIVAVVPPGCKLEALDSNLLEEHGWQRKPAQPQLPVSGQTTP